MGATTLHAHIPGPDPARTLALFRDLGQQLDLTMVVSDQALALHLPS